MLLSLHSVNCGNYFAGQLFFWQVSLYSLQNIATGISFFLSSINLILIWFIDNTSWASGEDDHVVARAEYDFVAVSEEEISFRAGDMLNLALKGKKT